MLNDFKNNANFEGGIIIQTPLTMKPPKLILTLLIIIMLAACKKDSAISSVTGQLKNLTGLDGCGWVIYLDKTNADGYSKLEPGNLNDFTVTKTDGQKVELTYNATNSASVCMVGQVVELTMIQDK